jgi:hypothetical protein
MHQCRACEAAGNARCARTIAAREGHTLTSPARRQKATTYVRDLGFLRGTMVILALTLICARTRMQVNRVSLVRNVGRTLCVGDVIFFGGPYIRTCHARTCAHAQFALLTLRTPDVGVSRRRRGAEPLPLHLPHLPGVPGSTRVQRGSTHRCLLSSALTRAANSSAPSTRSLPMCTPMLSGVSATCALLGGASGGSCTNEISVNTTARRAQADGGRVR